MNPILSRRFGGACASAMVALTLPGLAAIEQEAGLAAPPAVEGAPVEAAPAPGEQPSEKALQAVIMEVQGENARWRPAAEAPWKPAAVDDLLNPGAEIDVGVRSSLALRVGKNATLVVQRMTRLYLPAISEGTDTLLTRVAVVRGKAEFQVDKIGLVNDFQVSTPTTTLAIKGTYTIITHGGFQGTEVEGIATNSVNAIALAYFGRLQTSLSGAGTSSQGTPSQVLNALFNTIGPPAGAGTGEVDGGEALALAGQMPDQTAQNAQNVNNAVTTQMAIFAEPPNSTLPDPGPPPVPPPVIPPPPGGGGGSGTGGGAGGGGAGGGGAAGQSGGGGQQTSNPVVIPGPPAPTGPSPNGPGGVTAGSQQQPWLEGSTIRPGRGGGDAASGMNAHQRFLSERGMLRQAGGPGR